MEYSISLPCHFGMEAVLKRELTDLGLTPESVSDGRVNVRGGASLISDCNVFLRSAERVLIILSEFTAKSFEELFNGVLKVSFEEFFPQNAAFPITKASSIDSTLASPRDIQAIVKKAVARRMGAHYGIERLPEDGPKYPLRVFIKDDVVTLSLDTTGDSLHKRGYKKRVAKAPISETLAAALIMLTPFREDRILLDPFCGTGTFAIEAALISKGIAPGSMRSFLCEDWTSIVSKKDFKASRERAESGAKKDAPCNIYAYDIDPVNIGHAKANAALAGVEGSIHFKDADIKNISKDFYKMREEYGFIITNPPYGERLNGEDVFPLYKTLGELYKLLPTWSMYVITSFPEAQKALGGKAAKNRKIYNGMKKSYFYQYPGPKPPKESNKK